MKRIKEIINRFIEIWKIPKYKGLIQLAFWILFFLFVYIVFNAKNTIPSSNIPSNNEVKETETNQITSYIYNYQINDNENTINISGTYYNGIDLFNYNNSRYYIKNNMYYTLDNNAITIDYSLVEFQYNNILNLIKDKEYDSKTEYKDKNIEYTYTIDSLSYNNFYHKQYETNGNVVIKITYMNNYISNVIIDLSDYYIDKNIYQVIINYSNVNNINGLDINIE